MPRHPINPANRKVIVFTAFADTARYLYEELASWAWAELRLEAALVTGTGGNQTTLSRLRKDLVSILTAFAPRTKERPEDLSAEGEIDLLIATDCISEGQNLQDCDWLINYDIHWNPVRIIQRFGRIDRIGAPNERIQLVNFWPNLELEEYLRLEQRVSGPIVLLDISATGEENLIEQESGDPMNDLEYRRRQLLKLQDAVIDLEDLSSGVSEPLGLGIADWHAELEPAGDTTVVFRDSAFADDVAKTNLTAILEQRGLGNVRSLLAVDQWPTINRETSWLRYERRSGRACSSSPSTQRTSRFSEASASRKSAKPWQRARSSRTTRMISAVRVV